MATTSSVNIRFAATEELASIEEIRLNIPDVTNRYTVFLARGEKVQGLTYFKVRSEKVSSLDPQRVTYPKALSMKEEQVRGLTLSVIEERAGEQDLTSVEIPLQISLASKIGKINTIVFSGSNGVFSARLVNADEDQSYEERIKQLLEEYSRQDNLTTQTAANGASSGDDRARRVGGIYQGIAAVGNVMGLGVAVPSDQAPEFTTEQLQKMPTAELKTLFDKSMIKDKTFAIARLNAAQVGNVGEINDIIQNEKRNSELILRVSKVIETREGSVRMPTSQEFMDLEAEEARLSIEQMQRIGETCSIQ